MLINCRASKLVQIYPHNSEENKRNKFEKDPGLVILHEKEHGMLVAKRRQ